MKIKNVKIKKYKLLRLYLTKYESYNKDSLILSNNILDKLELSFKKVLLIIYQYHILNKKILFIGFPYSNNKKIVEILLKSNHIFASTFVRLKGLLGNNKCTGGSSKRTLKKNNYLPITHLPHLIVIFNDKNSNNLLSEALKLNIPIIAFGNMYKDLSNLIYLVEGRFITKKIKNFYQFLIYSILKKPKNKLIKITKNKKYYKK